jgi:hypothetical protein
MTWKNAGRTDLALGIFGGGGTIWGGGPNLEELS